MFSGPDLDTQTFTLVRILLVNGCMGPVDCGVGSFAPAALDLLDAAKRSESVDVVIREAKRGLHAHVIEPLLVKELVCGEAKVPARDREADEHRDAEYADRGK